MQSTNLNIDALVVDAGKGNGDVPTRIPEWLLPDVADELRTRMRPDILVVERTSVYQDHATHYRTYDAEARSTIKVHIIEVGFGPDTRYVEKLESKRHQHDELTEALRQAGWNVQPTRTLLFGVGGSIYNDVHKYLDEHLHLPAQILKHHLNTIQEIAWSRGYQLYQTRRHLERALIGRRPP